MSMTQINEQRSRQAISPVLRSFALRQISANSAIASTGLIIFMVVVRIHTLWISKFVSLWCLGVRWPEKWSRLAPE
jgi:hypothetical protein